MKNIELLEGFELEVNQLDSNLTKPNTRDSAYWVNNAIIKFITTRTFGNNYRTESFEQTQKRIDDLRTLVTVKKYEHSIPATQYDCNLPEDYMFTVGETAHIASTDVCWPKDNEGNPIVKDTDVLESTVETFDRQRSNVFSEYRLHHNTARPLRLYRGNVINLYTDGRYYIPAYTLTYIRLPKKINFNATVSEMYEEYTDLPASTHQEIIKMAAQLYLENQSNPRYESYSREINSME